MQHGLLRKAYYTAQEMEGMTLTLTGVIGVTLGALHEMLKAHRRGELISPPEASFVQAGYEHCVNVLRELLGPAAGGSDLAALLNLEAAPALPQGRLGAMVHLREEDLGLLRELTTHSWVWTARPGECQDVVASIVAQFCDGLARATPVTHGRKDPCEAG